MQLNQSLARTISIEVPQVECESGWSQIVEGSILCIDRYVKRRKLAEDYSSSSFDPSVFFDFKIEQIKEKFGGLRIYCSYHDEYIQGIIALAETMAYRTCEIRGCPGSLHRKGGMLKTLSPEAAASLGYEPKPHDHRKAITTHEIT